MTKREMALQLDIEGINIYKIIIKYHNTNVVNT